MLDFELEFKKWELQEQSFFKEITDFNNFKFVCVSESKTLCWPTITMKFENFKGETEDSFLDMDPDVLYQLSIPFKNFVLVRNVA